MQEGTEPAEQDACYLGLDGGGTQVRAVIVDRHGREVGRGSAGSANPSAVGLEVATANIWEAIELARRQAGVELPVAAAWCGLAESIGPPNTRRSLRGYKVWRQICAL